MAFRNLVTIITLNCIGLWYSFNRKYYNYETSIQNFMPGNLFWTGSSIERPDQD